MIRSGPGLLGFGFAGDFFDGFFGGRFFGWGCRACGFCWFRGRPGSDGFEEGGGWDEKLPIGAAAGGGAQDLAGGTEEHGGAVDLDSATQLVLWEVRVCGDRPDELDLVAVGKILPRHKILADGHDEGEGMVFLLADLQACLFDAEGFDFEVGFPRWIEAGRCLDADGGYEVVSEL